MIGESMYCKCGDYSPKSASFSVTFCMTVCKVCGLMPPHETPFTNQEHNYTKDVVAGEAKVSLPEDELNWEEAADYLCLCEKHYAAIGSPGSMAMRFVIYPVRDRFNAGERSADLYGAIFDIAFR